MPGVALLDALLHHVPDLVGILAPDGRYLYTGPAYERVLGYPPSTLTGKSSLGYVHPDDMPAMQDALRRVTASDGATAGLHLRHRHAGGSWRELETTLTSHLKDPAVRGIVISSREPAEHADRGPSLAELHGQELDTTLAAIGDAVVIYDRAARIIVANRTARTLFGMDSHPDVQVLPLGAWIRRLRLRNADGTPMTYEEIPAVRALGGETLSGDNAVDIQFTSLRGREVELNVTATPILDESAEISGAVCVYRDVTNRRGLERTLLVERDRLRIVLTELRAIEARRDEFLSSLSHDLKNPLTGLRGLAQLVHRQITNGTFDRESALRHLESMIESTGTMTHMVDDLVRASRQRANRNLVLEREPVDLVALTRSFAAVQQPAADQDIIVEAAQDEIIVPSNPLQMERVISNLVWNAIKYSSRQSRVWVRLSVDGTCAVLSVTDEGIGIPADELQHIFERFYRARNVSPEVPGTGVGLVSALEIVQAYGGSLSVESEEGRGSTFTVRLPLQA